MQDDLAKAAISGAIVKTIFTVLLCMGMTAAMAQQVYKWVDKQGHAHYSQMPPANKSDHAKSIDVTPPPVNPVGVKQAQKLEQQAQALNRQAAAEQKQADAAARKKALKQKLCNELRADLQVLEAVGRVATVGPDGKRTYLSDKQHAQKEQQLRDEISQSCGG